MVAIKDRSSEKAMLEAGTTNRTTVSDSDLVAMDLALRNRPDEHLFVFSVFLSSVTCMDESRHLFLK